MSGDDPEFRAATNLFRELSLKFWLAVTLLESAELLANRDQVDDAQPLVAEARAIFDSLKATPWLERAAKVGLERILA